MEDWVDQLSAGLRGMLTYKDVIVNFLPPILILVSGYSLRVVARTKARGLVETWIESVVLGSALLVVPAVVIGSVLGGSLRTIFWAYLAATVALASLAFQLERTVFLFSPKRFWNRVRNLPQSSLLEVIAFAGFASLLGKAVVVLSFGPLGIDAMASILPDAVYFKDFNDFGPFADPPAVSLLYSWALSTVGIFSIDAFRLIPLMFLIGIPGLVYLIARKYLGQTYALVALALSSFAPLTDQSLLIWAHYTDLPGLFFAFAGVWFLLRERSESLSGLCLGLALLSKSVYGLAGAWLCAFAILGSSHKRRSSQALFVATVSVILAYGLVANSSKIAMISPAVSLIVALLMVAFVTVCFVRAFPILTGMPRIPLLLIVIAPALLWILRQVLMGGSPLALPLFVGSGNDAAWWLNFRAQISGPVQLSWTVLLSIFCYPSFDLYLTPFVVVGLVLGFWKFQKPLFLFAASYVLYFGSMGAFFTVRHLAFFLFSLYPLIAAGLVSLVNRPEDQRHEVLGIVTLAYIVLSVIQQPMGFLSLEWLSLYAPCLLGRWLCLWTAARIARLLGVTSYPWLDHPDGISLDMLRVLAQGILLSAIITVLARSLNGRFRLRFPTGIFSHLPPIKSRKWATVLLLFVMVSAMVVQGYYSGAIVAGHNPLNFPVAASWYREKIEVSLEMADLVPRGETVLTFSFGAYYYMASEGIYYVDLIDGALSSYPLRGLSFTSTLKQLLQSENPADIKNALTSIDATFMLVPTVNNSTVPFEYSLFERFNQNSALLRILHEAGALTLVWEHGHYQLYALRYEMAWDGNTVPQSANLSLWIAPPLYESQGSAVTSYLLNPAYLPKLDSDS